MAFRAAEYERYDGLRSNRPTWIPIARATLQRGWSSKWVRRLTFMALLMGLTVVVILYIANQTVPEWRTIAEEAGSKVTNDDGFRIDARWYVHLTRGFVNPFVLILSLMFGHDLIASDLRTNAMEAYFARPITPLSYLFGRTVAFVGFLMAATFGPILAIWVGDLMFSAEGHFEVIKHVPIRLFLALLLTCTTVALMVQAITILTRSAIWTNLVFLVIFVMLQGMGLILWGITQNDNMLAISYFHDTWVVAASMLGELEHSRSDHVPAGLAFAVLISLSALSFFIVHRGLKRRSLLS